MPSLKTDPDIPLLDAVRAWRDQPARADVRALPRVSVPALAAMRKYAPDESAKRILTAAYRAAIRLSQPQSVLRAAQAERLTELRQRPAEVCDAQARRISSRAGWLAGGSGAVLGVAGAAGMVADAPTLIVQALRVLMRIGYCYGEAPSPALAAALFALASADSDEEKRLAWNTALTAAAGDTEMDEGIDISDAAIRDGLERAAEREFAKQALAGSLQKMASTLAQRLGMRKAAGLLPIVGAAVGGAVNIRFIYLLAEAARMAFAARHALRNGAALDSLKLHPPQLDSTSAPNPAAITTRRKPAKRRST